MTLSGRSRDGYREWGSKITAEQYQDHGIIYSKQGTSPVLNRLQVRGRDVCHLLGSKDKQWLVVIACQTLFKAAAEKVTNGLLEKQSVLEDVKKELKPGMGTGKALCAWLRGQLCSKDWIFFPILEHWHFCPTYKLPRWVSFCPEYHYQPLFFSQPSQTWNPFEDMYVHKTPPTPLQNTVFPGLNLKVGKINYRLGRMDSNWAKLECLKSGQNFSRSSPEHEPWKSLSRGLHSFLYFREIRKKRSYRPGGQSAPRLYNRYNHCPCARPAHVGECWPGPEFKFSKTVQVGWSC